MNSNDYTTVDHILAEVLVTCNDRELRSGLSKGWYISRIQDALQELAFDTFYQIITRDFDMPTDTLSMELPKNCFNIREIYGWNGSCCSPQTSAIIYIKRLYNNKGGDGRGYTAQVKKTGETIGNDPFQPNTWNDGMANNYSEARYFGNIQDGRIMFSSSCASFPKIRLVYNGMGGEIGDLPVIPRFFERAINDYVEERFYNTKKGEDPRTYRSLWSDAYSRLESFTGNWQKAIKRIKMMDSKTAADYQEYLAGIYHK